MAPTLPIQIVNQIVDHLHDDTAALSQGSLVCKRWISCTRFHLFSDLSIDEHRHDDTFDKIVKQGATFISFVRKLRINSAGGDSPDKRLYYILSRLPVFPAIDRLVLKGFIWPYLNFDAKRFIRRIIPQLVGLDLTDVQFNYLEDIEDIILAAPMLKCLFISGQTVPTQACKVVVHRKNPAHQISKLRIDFSGTSFHHFCKWVITPQCTVLDIESRDTCWLKKCHHILGASLVHLRLRFRKEHRESSPCHYIT